MSGADNPFASLVDTDALEWIEAPGSMEYRGGFARNGEDMKRALLARRG